MSATVLSLDPRAAPALSRMVRRAAVRVRIFRIGRALLGTSIAVLLTALLLVTWELVHPALELPWLPVPPMGATMGLVAFAGFVFSVAVAVRTPDTTAIARQLDRALGLDDRASTALAIATGQVRGGLAEKALQDAERVLVTAAPGVAEAFPARPGIATGRQLRLLAVLTLVGVLGGWLGGFVQDAPPFSFTPPGGPQAGDTEKPPAAPGVIPATPGEDEPDAPDEDPSVPDPETDPQRPPVAQPPAEEPTKTEAGARARIVSLREHFLEGEAITVVVSGFPTVHLQKPTSYRIRLEIDGKPVDPDLRLWIEPDAPEGDAEALDLRTLPAADRLLSPGEHTAVAVLLPENATPSARSAEVRFEVHGPRDPDGDGQGSGPGPQPKGGQQSQPQPPPQQDPPPPEQPRDPPPEQQPPPPPPPPPPESGDPPPDVPPPGARPPTEPPPETEPGEIPEIDLGFETKVVMPLFGEGEEIVKEGPVLVLVPGRADDPAPRSRPLAEVLQEAVRQAEETVDRARLDVEDRELVRRYFRRIEHLLR